MKTILLKLSVFTVLFVLFSTTNSWAQRVSVTLNVQDFGIERLSNGTVEVEEGEGEVKDFNGETSFSANVRLYDNNLWALRLGVGVSNLKYRIADGVDTDFEVKRQNLVALVGLEKHFRVSFLTPYLGVFVPITFNGEDKFKDNLSTAREQFRNGDVKAGFSVLVGANIKLFKFLRLGAEFNAGFDKFKSEVIQNLGNASDIKLRNLEYNTEVTIGIAF